MNDRLATQRFWSKVIKGPGCWLWTGPTGGGGYGRFRVTPTARVSAHRFAYEQVIGPIPDGLQLDHLCRTRSCVRPDHLEPVTNRTNVLRGTGPTARNAKKTHCPRGHLYAGENLHIEPTGRRKCRACGRAHARRRYAADRRLRGEGDQP